MDALNYHKSRKGPNGNFYAINGVMPTHGLVCNVDDLDSGIVGPTCQIGWLAHPSVVKKGIMMVRLLLTFAQNI